MGRARALFAWSNGLLLALGGVTMAPADSAAQTVSNVRATQLPDKTVEVLYDLAGAPARGSSVSVAFSQDDGVSYTITPQASALSGDVGPGITNGANRRIVWVASKTMPEGFSSTTMRAAVTVGGGDELVVSLPGGVPLKMVKIEPEAFSMGSSFHRSEEPVHEVTISHAFFLGETEVTQEQYAAVKGVNPSYHSSCGTQCPVENVSWDTFTWADGFLGRLNSMYETTRFRLPSEAEWEYAALGGTGGPFYFGDDAGCEYRCDCGYFNPYMWWCGNNSPDGPKPVKGKAPNSYGLYDMNGNVEEFVEDWFHPDYAGAPTDGSAWLSPPGDYRVIRGGYYGSTSRACRAPARNYEHPHFGKLYVGFRLAASVEESSSPSNQFTLDLGTDPLTGTVGIRDDQKLWPLDGLKVTSIAVKATPAGGGTPLTAKVTDAVYTFSGIAPGSYDLECEVIYQEEVTIDNTSSTRGNGCAGRPLTKHVLVRKRGVGAPGTVDIELPRPVVMLHGYRSCYQTWFDDSAATNKWDNYARLEGYHGAGEDLGFISLTPNYDFTESDWQVIANQALKNIGDDLRGLSRQIDTDSYPQWDIVAHSMGGLVSRVITNHKGNFAPLARELLHVFMMGTPNSGTSVIRLSHLSEESIQGDFNFTYHDFGGKPAEAWAGTDGWGFSTRSDSVVMVDSVQNIYQQKFVWLTTTAWSRRLPAYSFKGDTFHTHPFNHTQLGSPDEAEAHPRTEILVNEMLPRLAGASSGSGARAATTGTEPEETPLVVVAAGSMHLEAGEAVTVSVTCEPTDLLVAVADATSSGLAYRLMDPDGVAVAAGVTPSGRVAHETAETGEEWYAVSNPETGTWEMRLTAGASACDAAYTVMVRSPLTMQTSVTTPVVAQGGVADLVAVWRGDPPPGTTATVSADLIDTAGTTVETVTLHDDGSHGDRLAGDGLFVGTSHALGATGRYAVRFRATGLLGGSAPFARTAGAILDVIDTGQVLTGAFSDSAADSDGDGTFDSVIADIGVDLPHTGSFLVSGRLVDSDGYPLDQGVGHLEATTAGEQTINLQLSLAVAGCGQFAEGFLLTDLRLRDGATLAVLDRWTEAVPTAVYAGSTFGCQTTTPAPAVLAVDPSTALPGETRALLISGAGFQSDAQVALGAGVVVQGVSVVAQDTVLVNVAVDASAALGARDVSVTNPDLRKGTLAGGFTVASDQAPTISISHPAADQRLSGLVTFSASAWDDQGIVSVDFRVDGAPIGSDASFPYQAQWQASSAGPGFHVLEATARDTIGQTSTATVRLQIGSNSPRVPARRVTSGSDGQCTYSLSPPSRSHGAEAGSGTISVSTTAGCGWAATPAVGWIHIDSGGSGTGSGTVSYRVDANPLGTARTGTVAVANRSFTVSQAARSGPTCGLDNWQDLNPGGATADTHFAGSVSNGSVHLIFGFEGAMLRSTDGNTWTPVTTGTSAYLFDGVWNGSYFVVIGENGHIMTSPNGVTWTPRTSGTTNSLWGITWGGGLFVAVGDHATLLTSSNGVTWTSRSNPVDPDYSLWGVEWHDGRFVAVGTTASWLEAGTVITSSNGVSWTLGTLPTTYGWPYRVKWLNGHWVTVGVGGYMASSPDGLSWTLQTTGEGADLLGIVWNGETYAIPTSVRRVMTSADLTDWTFWKIPVEASRLQTILWTGERHVVGGMDGTLVGTVCAGDPLVVTTTANAGGLNDARWTTDLDLHNSANESASVEVELLKRDIANPDPDSVSVTVNAGESLHLSNLLEQLFDYTGTASLRLTPGSGKLSASSRTYNTASTGTFGQFIPAVPVSFAISGTDEGRLVQLSRSADRNQGYRSNIGFVNVGDGNITVLIDLYRGDGTLLGQTSVVLRPGEHRQLTDVFAAVTTGDVAEGYAVLHADSGSARYLAYASVVDNRSGDPIYIPVQ